MRALIAVVFVAFAGLVAVGFARDWFTLATVEQVGTAEEKVDLKLTVDRGKIKEDAEAAREKLAEVATDAQESAKDLAEKATEGAKDLGAQVRQEVATAANVLDGTIQVIDPATQRMTVKTGENQETIVHVNAGSQILLNDAKTDLASLKAGDRVAISYSDKAGTKVAEKVTATRDNKS